ncbi:hypothetical protein [Nocardiopsis sp. CC223A]|uniref:hypothetical protein n=1 Tax=Nocardiopsis sp. CC223A TaxID=3044051 RepID=UPI00279553D2|nr:hypothetical protein [Nocardiopsis sp. CC223A]
MSQPPPHHPTAPPAHGRPGAPHPHHHPVPAQQARPKRPSTVAGVLLIWSGIIAGLLGLLIVVLPYMLFVLGGGGDATGFDDFARAFLYTGCVVAFLGLLMFVFGIVRTVSRRRARREWDRTYYGTP